jgi:ABC-type uncharacterized transport system substrate-binding protein
MTYAVNSADEARQVASYVDRLLRGANPAELPVEQPSKFELVFNSKTARALGLTIPQSISAARTKSSSERRPRRTPRGLDALS